MITGGLHLDGLADTIDALASRKDKAEMLKIMRDSHIGTMGVLSLIIIIILKIAILSSLNPAIKNLSLILMCLLSRYSLVLTMFSFPYAREEGKAKIFIRGMNLKIFTLSSIAAFIFAFIIWRLKGILMLLIITGCTYLIGKIINRKIGGITGDTLGAINELTEVIVLLSMFFLT
jgi:adenosylcobinamide-GDP ribazoletransferase